MFQQCQIRLFTFSVVQVMKMKALSSNGDPNRRDPQTLSKTCTVSSLRCFLGPESRTLENMK